MHVHNQTESVVGRNITLDISSVFSPKYHVCKPQNGHIATVRNRVQSFWSNSVFCRNYARWFSRDIVLNFQRSSSIVNSSRRWEEVQEWTVHYNEKYFKSEQFITTRSSSRVNSSEQREAVQEWTVHKNEKLFKSEQFTTTRSSSRVNSSQQREASGTVYINEKSSVSEIQHQISS